MSVLLVIHGMRRAADQWIRFKADVQRGNTWEHVGTSWEEKCCIAERAYMSSVHRTPSLLLQYKRTVGLGLAESQVAQVGSLALGWLAPSR